MSSEESLPAAQAALPEPGFYYHYKHDPAGPWNGYAYEVVGTGFCTEPEMGPKDGRMVIYRPLYDWAIVYRLGKMSYLRPLTMFAEQVDKAEYQGPRFRKIEDPELVTRLIEQREQMYG